MPSRFASTLLTAALLLNTTAALAARPVGHIEVQLTSEEVVAKIRSYDANTLCAGRTGTELGKCVTDMIKALRRLQDELHDALELERTAWEADHASLGASPEYRTARTAYLQEVSARRKAFNDAKRAIEKSFFDMRRTVRVENSGGTTGFSRPISASDIEDATQKCAKHRDTDSLRICLRNQLRMSDPNARRMGAGIRQTGQ